MTKQKVAIVSGGTGYVGSAIVEALKNAGWIVAPLSHDVCDVTDAEAVQTFVGKLVSKHREINACIHAAATPIERVPVFSSSPASFDAIIKVAAAGAYNLANALLLHMPKGSAFIGITTEAIEPGSQGKGAGAYVPAKYALRGFLHALTYDAAERGIRVYAIAPGFLPGGLNSDLPKAFLDFFKKKNPDAPSADDVGALVVKVCDEPGAFESGSSITVGEIVTPL